jgi:hypothetical protein
MSKSPDYSGVIVLLLLLVCAGFMSCFALGFFTNVTTWLLIEVIMVGIVLKLVRRELYSYVVFTAVLMFGVSWGGMRVHHWFYGDI